MIAVHVALPAAAGRIDARRNDERAREREHDVVDLTEEEEDEPPRRRARAPTREEMWRTQLELAARTTVRGIVVAPNCGVCLANLPGYCAQAYRAQLLSDLLLPAARKQVFDFGYVTLSEYRRLLFASHDLVATDQPASPGYTEACTFVRDVFDWVDTTQAIRLEAIRKLCPYRARSGKQHIEYAPLVGDTRVEIVLVNTRNPLECNINDFFVVIVQFADDARITPIYRAIITPPSILLT